MASDWTRLISSKKRRNVFLSPQPQHASYFFSVLLFFSKIKFYFKWHEWIERRWMALHNNNSNNNKDVTLIAQKDTEWRAGWWLICNILSDSSTSIVSPSSPESFALALKLKINTLKVTIIERSLIDVWIFFHRIILKTGAICGERSFKYVVVYELCVVSVKEQQT